MTFLCANLKINYTEAEKYKYIKGYSILVFKKSCFLCLNV